MRLENSRRVSQRRTSARLRERRALRTPVAKRGDASSSGRARGKGERHAATRAKAVKPARAKKSQRHPQPSPAEAEAASVPTTTPTEPAKVHRAMFCSWREGSVSMRVAWDRLTNGPDAG